MLTAAQTAQANKALVRRLVQDVRNDGRLEVIDELYTPKMAPVARRWIEPFRNAFPDAYLIAYH
jgi:hypothetical protein